MPHYVTEDGLKAMQAELEDIVGTQLPAVLSSLESALKDGDIKENSPLSAAREMREQLLTRQAEIEEILEDYELIQDSKNSTIVKIGSSVTVNFLSNNLTSTYRIVGGSESNPAIGLISDESPLGAALLGKKVNSEVSYKAPSGSVTIKIIKIS